LMDIATKFASG
jgi:hypothetical protein